MAETLARDVGERERRRLAAEGFPSGSGDALGTILLGLGAWLAAAARWAWQLLTRPVDPP